MDRAEAVAAITGCSDRTPEQAGAFLDILGSAFRRRGWIDGEPLSEPEIGERLGVFLGPGPGPMTDQPRRSARTEDGKPRSAIDRALEGDHSLCGEHPCSDCR